MLNPKNKLPKISIITPSYNQAEFIKRTIDSVLSQDYPNLEYIVMDGGSTDKTVEILKKYGSKIIWKSEKDKGQGDAINKGLKRATGDLLGYLNSDDTLTPNSLLTLAEIYLKNPSYHWFFGKCKVVDEKDREIRKQITAYKNFWLKRYNYQTLLILDYISQPATFWTKEACKNIGNFNEKEYWELDYEYWLRLGKKYEPKFIDKYLANFRVHKKAKTSIGVKHFWQEFEVAKRFTNNPLILGLHLINFLSIVIVYTLLSKK
jgi:glycosyltransferase involved in cell wall biosynthesis